MKLLTKTIPRTCNIYLAGDEHDGADLRHKHGCDELIKLIANDPIGYLVHQGDAIEAITINDKRYDRSSIDSTASTRVWSDRRRRGSRIRTCGSWRHRECIRRWCAPRLWVCRWSPRYKV